MSHHLLFHHYPISVVVKWEVMNIGTVSRAQECDEVIASGQCPDRRGIRDAVATTASLLTTPGNESSLPISPLSKIVKGQTEFCQAFCCCPGQKDEYVQVRCSSFVSRRRMKWLMFVNFWSSASMISAGWIKGASTSSFRQFAISCSALCRVVSK
ncbi:hypothetical protein U27_04521 [Candidatus Vecturithrix granuli]|uniref:Uncharacterized protein n=1 Tax=Vecturithrix granuli TaxID=1499967 RepID=A0A081BYZ9_VECG1|nr:hypothetical protein U27_04521 [Candidatus Vecturithrix granuli]